ncbi:NADH-quinone oxidoreductase subunit N [Hallella sp.]|uniref:NADH-quinone oxidoreductase subunit N n=1 Tax=Hallella TaxID=52228 RepID=UPI0025843FCA|nr:NADH-quinone oxidoreductase subunit N [Hallella sp.]MBS7400579.1 NADH-quinone oxidoreductase subunit N [Prevotella sp.]MDD7145216.1 NADH-quinone oxidoreductase subunit N [Hallella sp.]MDR3844200.1 NADH-quinone oxidoreductase subunit N [Hallella sp.]MDR3999710.1 NADH-quinone oxidoreductase subunit N [Hallella sp.]MDY5925760.1 NADH-quinone oxidoreductase subunit N [Hallella sp.]
MNIDYSQFLNMIPEVTLMAALMIVFITDLFTAKKPGEARNRNWFNPLVCVLMLAHIFINIWPTEASTAFGGMYMTNGSVGVIKTILAFSVLIVFVQSREWLQREDTNFKEGEFYELVLATLLGMNMMVSANHFLLFFLGLEMASVPMACLVAFDKYRHNSAEAGAKFILTATFSSGVMLYGISFLYAATGTLYFDDVMANISATPLCILGMVFFFSGLGFKISLVPFHFWTADTYQGAPTTVTGYLSVTSKGAAAFALCAILMKVFAPIVEYWQIMLMVVIVLSITIGNLFAIHQKDLKRFMAFSSISQAGYIMLAVVGNSAMSVTALSYYVLIYVVANLAVFSIIAAVEENNGGVVNMNAYNGFYKTNPRLAFLLTLALFSLGGIPPFAGMFSKFFVFMAAANGAQVTTAIGATIYAVVFIALVNTVISLYYYLLIVKAMFISDNENPLPTFKSSCSTKMALAICTLGVVAFGVCSIVYNWIHAASVM